jgi:hypothetical protein
MEINADFSKRAAVHAAKLDWKASPMAGVERRMLDRVGAEVARATSIVRYAPGSHFSPHTHDGGEEFLVLDGVFQDEHGDFPTGSYIRNPPTSRHTPGSDAGCVILVKLWQFDLEDRTQIRLASDQVSAITDPARPGVSVIPLFKDQRENVRIETWSADTEVPVGDLGGSEYFVLDGGFEQEGEHFEAQSWLRLPAGDTAFPSARAGAAGARVWIKTGHLRDVTGPKL